LQTFAGGLPHAGTDPSGIIGLQAGNGLPLDGKPGSRWFLTGAPQASLAAMQSTLREWKLAPSRVEAAGVAMLGAVLAELRRTSAAPVLIWDIGETASELFLVGSQELQAVSRLAFGFDKVAESVQTELNLKFKGAAAKLFFNEFYDFSEIGPKIAERVADSLRSAVTEISATSGAPAALLCTGLTSKQSWFTEQVAKSVALVPWQPDMVAWCDQAGLTFVGNTLQAKLSPGWLGLLSIVVASQVGESTTDSAWHPAWGRDASAAEDKPSAVAAVPSAPKPTPPPAAVRPAAVPPTPRTIPPAAAAIPAAPRPTPPAPPAKASVPPAAAAPAIARTISPAPPVKAPAAPVPVVKTIPPTAPAITATVRVQPPAAVASKTIPPTPPAKAPAAPVPTVKIIPPAAASATSPVAAVKPVAVTPAKAAAASPAKPPEKAAVLPTVTPAAKPAPAKPAPAAPAAPSGSPKPYLAAKPATSGEPPAGPRPFLKTPAGLAVIGALVLVLAASFFFYQQFSEQKAEALRKQAQAEQHAAAEAEAARKAEQQAKTEKEARRQAEEDSARKTAAAEAARQQAAEETRRHEVETNRLLNGRGLLAIVTEPAGATIAISNFAPRVSPATISDLRLGHYAVSVTLAGYDPVTMDVEVKENETTDPGPIHLVRQTGSLELATDPPGVSFEVRPAAARFFAAGADVKQGKTPATLADLPTGEYAVIFSREGWPNHAENAVIESKGTAHVTSKFVGGSIEITTTPPGARVTRNGATVGTTPLTLQDQQPGDVEFTLELQGFTTTFVSGRTEPEKSLQLNATFNSQDRIAHLNELDAPPSATKSVEPAVSYQQQKSGGTAVISLTIDRDGTPKDLKVDSASDPEFGRRCLAAAAQWRFKPATIKGIPVKTRVALPFKL
jgi:TonB family protein